MKADDPDSEPTPEELREAASLAAALDGVAAAGSGEPPDDALAAAALVREGHGGGQLGDERRDAVLERVLVAEARARPRRVLRFVLPSLALAAAAALALVVLRPGARSVAPTELPDPAGSVLRAQLDVARGGDPSRLDEEMRAYRREVYAALRRRYGGVR